MKRKLNISVLSIACALLALFVGAVQPARAHDPKPVLRSIYAAPLAVVTMYEVKPGSQEDFINAMVTSGPFNRVLNGFANERILQAVPGSGQDAVVFLSFARYYDKATAAYIDAQRQPAIAAFLVKDPVRVDAILIEHELADWGWEKGTDQAVLNVRPMQNEEIFERNVSSLSFFKSGYTGQVGMVEVVPANSQLTEIRANLSSRMGLSGASIFSTPSGMLVYSEYFKSPANAASMKLTSSTSGLNGAQAAVVIQNYVSR